MNMAPANIARADQHVQEMLRVRKSSPLFRLRTGQDVMDHVRFDNVGPGQIPGLIIMRLGKDGQDELVVVINTTSQPQTAAVAKGSHYRLHEILQHSGDPVVRKSRAKKGKLITPPLTPSVFVEEN